MGLNFPASVTCDKCDRKTSVKLEITKLKPHVEMHLKIPDGWSVSSLADSGELLLTCPKCPAVLVSLPPPIPDPIPPDPATDPTMRPPPPILPTRIR